MNQRRLCMQICAAAAVFAAPCCRSAPTDTVGGAWQNHKLTFNYFGITTLYTCDGLEEHVRRILLHLGARKDAKVTAGGCLGPSNAPSRSALVSLDFYALAPATEGSDAVKARWAPLELAPHRPSFMGDGDCELIKEMKGVITQNFSLREVAYRTRCVPHAVTIDAFEVKGKVLRALPNPQPG